MTGTILCGVTDTQEGRGAVQLAGALRDRLGLRLVLAHVVDSLLPAQESVSTRHERQGAERALASIVRELELDDGGVETRVVVGPRDTSLAKLAADEGADLIVLGSRARGFRGKHLGCTLARELEAATPAPVVVAPPQSRKRSEQRLAVADVAAAR